MNVTQKELKREVKKLVDACVRESDGFRASSSFAELKRKCKQSESIIDLLYRCLKNKLRNSQVETRLCALNIADEFFMRSHHFRTLLLDEFGQLVDCVLDVRIDSLLGDSREAVRDLRKQAIRLLRKWQTEFGSGYPQIANAFDYLRYSKKLFISDEDGAVTTPGDIRERLERERREEQIATRKLAGAQGSFNEFAGELHDCKAEVDSLLQIFRSADPRPASNSNPGTETKQGEFEVVETDENSDLVELFLKQRFKLENEFTEKLQTIIRSLSTSLSYANVAAFARELIDTKRSVEESVRDAKNVRVLRDATRQRSSRSFERVRSTAESDADESDDDDDDFVEVQPDGRVTETAARKPAPDAPCSSRTHLEQQPNEDAFEIDPKTLQLLQRSVEQGETDSGDATTKPKTVNVSRREDSAWVRCDSNEVELPASFCADLQRGVFTFAGRFEPVTRCCNAPLAPSDGTDKPRLCPRRDRFKCPFHGVIVDRDEFGRPVVSSATDAAAAGSSADAPSASAEEREQLRQSISEAVRSDLSEHAMRQIEQDMKANSKGNRKRKREQHETPKERLSEILLDSRTLERVAQVENDAHRKRNDRRFAQQFNYMLS